MDHNMHRDPLRVNEELLRFIEESPSCFHAAEAARGRLLARGFVELSEDECWTLSSGNYFVMRNHSSLIAFTVPEETGALPTFRIAASHSDSPTFKIKENPEILSERYVTLNVEKYGGMLCAPWLDRPLSVAGRVFVRDEEKGGQQTARQDGDGEKEAGSAAGFGIREVLVKADRDLLLIPNVAIHLNRNVNDGYKYNAQTDLLPLYAMESGKDSFMKRIAEAAGVSEADILGHDLYLYNRERGSIWGSAGEFVSAPRLDDLQCAFGTLCGFLHGARKAHISLWCMLDNEEVGSDTRQGAGSTFLYDTVQRICASRGISYEQYLAGLAKSFMVSADNAHAVHPNHKELADPTNRPYLCGGIVIKYNAQQKYCTDGYSSAWFKLLCKARNVPYQSYANRSDQAGGSTLGNISNTKLALSSVDIGLPQLAMHSPYETAGCADTVSLIEAMRGFYE